jgi:hypothetical protein
VRLTGEPVCIEEANAILLQTRRKWKIPNELRPERPRAALLAAIDHIKDIRPNAKVRSISAQYNCMGLVVACRRVWVYPEHAVKILTDDGYTQLGGPEQADLGDVVIYHDEKGEPVHIGIVAGKNVLMPGVPSDPLTVLSKWGATASITMH